jgi:hypothetical protein
MSDDKSTPRLRGRTPNRREFAQRIIDALDKQTARRRLPLLSAGAKRLLLLRLRQLTERLGFAGGAHRRWPDSAEKRQAAARARRVPGEEGFYDWVTCKAIPSEQDLHDFVFARQNDAETIDPVGRMETATLIVGTFLEIVEVCFAIWRKVPDRHYEEFNEWLERIRLVTIAACRSELSEPIAVPAPTEVPAAPVTSPTVEISAAGAKGPPPVGETSKTRGKPIIEKTEETLKRWYAAGKPKASVFVDQMYPGTKGMERRKRYDQIRVAISREQKRKRPHAT